MSNWWEEAKASSVERKKAAQFHKNGVNVGDSFLIVTEGEVSEQIYLEKLKQEFKLRLADVIVLPGSDSHPYRVLDTALEKVKALEKLRKKKKVPIGQVEKYDHVWIVIDADVLDAQGQWNDFQAKLKGTKIKVAYTAPCIEYWFHLHLEYTTSAQYRGGKDASANAKKLFKERLGMPYNTNRTIAEQAISTFYRRWKEAVENARKCRNHHESANTPIPAFPSTTVDLLVTDLNLSARR